MTHYVKCTKETKSYALLAYHISIEFYKLFRNSTKAARDEPPSSKLWPHCASPPWLAPEGPFLPRISWPKSWTNNRAVRRLARDPIAAIKLSSALHTCDNWLPTYSVVSFLFLFSPVMWCKCYNFFSFSDFLFFYVLFYVLKFSSQIFCKNRTKKYIENYTHKLWDELMCKKLYKKSFR